MIEFHFRVSIIALINLHHHASLPSQLFAEYAEMLPLLSCVRPKVRNPTWGAAAFTCYLWASSLVRITYLRSNVHSAEQVLHTVNYILTSQSSTRSFLASTIPELFAFPFPLLRSYWASTSQRSSWIRKYVNLFKAETPSQYSALVIE